jgi:hypothetical protein
MFRKTVKSLGESLACISRKTSQTYDPTIIDLVNQLRTRGFVVLDHLVGSSDIIEFKGKLDKKIEQEFDLKFPCLAQSKIDQNRDRDLIAKSFLTTTDELKKRGLTFSRDDIQSYNQMIDTFKPSTLTVPMPSESTFYNLWLDPIVVAIVSNYMGFYPQLTEAYIRRNFPCTYPVMNHNWHRDTNHDTHLLKAFMFFTDCDIDTGAHYYIAGSVNDARFREKPYYTDDEINSAWPTGSDDHMVSKVKAGTIIIEDTRGLHKAGIPKKDYRDLGFAVFLPPNIFRKPRPLYHIQQSEFDHLTKEQKLFIPSSNILNG